MTRSDKQLISEAYTSNIRMDILFEQHASIPADFKNGLKEFVTMAVELKEKQDSGAELTADQKKIVNAFSDPTGKQLEEIFKTIQPKSNQPQSGPNQPQVQKEAFEKFRSNLSGIWNNTGPTGVINKRYELFLKDINGHLWEVGEDAKTLNVNPAEIQNFINKIVTIEPEVAEKGKFLQKLGYNVGRAVGKLAFAAPFALAASYLAPAMGLYGISAKALSGALAGGGKLATVYNNKQMSNKEKVYSILGTAFAGYNLYNLFGGGAAPGQGAGQGASEGSKDLAHTQGAEKYYTNQPEAPVGPSISSSKEFEVLHGSAPNYDFSKLDNVKQAISDLLKDKGFTGVSHGMHGVGSPTIMNAMDVAGINTKAEYEKVFKGLAGLHRSILGKMQSDFATAVEELRKLK